MGKKTLIAVGLMALCSIPLSASADEDRSQIQQLEKDVGVPSTPDPVQDKTMAPQTVYDSCTPNPAALCTAPRPPKGDPYMRRCWDKLCPEQKKAFYNKYN